MRKLYSLFVLVVLLPAALSGQTFLRKSTVPPTLDTAIDSTTLPLVLMKLPFLWPPWDPIPDTPKVTVDMAVIDNGYNKINHVKDPHNVYSGKIGIEKRGSISQAFWYQQKSYGFETRDTAGNSVDSVLLGMPKEHDWVLYAPFDDHTLMRNVLTYQLGREMGYWTPRTRFCELQFYDWLWTPDYRGVYVMMEKIKWGKHRVNIARLDTNDNAGDSLTGGYLFAVDRNIWANDSGWHSTKDTGVFFSYKYPKQDNITPQQKKYLHAYVDSFETSLQSANFADPAKGYRKFMEPTSFMDFFFIQELSKNLDAYRRSAYLFKNKNSKGGKLVAGPVWDFNSAWFNAKLCTFDQDTGWAYKTVCWLTSGYHIPFWWERLMQDSIYTRDLKCRWMQWRSTVLDTVHIFHIVDSIAGYIHPASVRHFSRFTINTDLATEVDTLKWWIRTRLAWMDAHMPGNCWNLGVSQSGINSSIVIYPNPSRCVYQAEAGEILRGRAEIIDMLGKKIRSFPIAGQRFSFDLADTPPGLYFLKITSGTSVFEAKIVRIE